MRLRDERRHGVWVCVVLAAALAACEPGDGQAGPATSGRFVGEHVSFQLADGEASAFRFAGMECRIAHPLNAAVALCLVRAPGLPSGTLPVRGGALDGVIEGVQIIGAIGPTAASGTWRFASACPDGQACAVEGVWTAQRVAEPGLADAVGDSGPGDAAGLADASDPLGDQGPLGGDGVGPLPDAVVPEPVVPTSASAEQREAAELLAEIRAAIGLPMPEQIDGINAAAQAHADYYVAHAAQYAAAGLSSHSENPAWAEGFTGESPGDRLTFQGVTPGNWSEVMAFSGSPAGALNGWMDTLYHREPLVLPNLARWGFGMARAGKAQTEVIDATNGPTDAMGPALWPVPDAPSVARSWNGFESPTPPLPSGEKYPSGPIVTVTFERSVTLSFDEASLTSADGGAVPIQIQTPENDPYLGSTWGLYAYSPLAAGTRYTARFSGRVDGEDATFQWSFTTR